MQVLFTIKCWTKQRCVMMTLLIHFMLCWIFYLCLVFYLFPNSSQFNSAIETILILISLKIQSISENQLRFLPLTFSPALIWAISELTNRAVILRNFFSGLYWMKFTGSLFSFLVYAHVLVVSREKVHERQICWDLACLRTSFHPHTFMFGYIAKLD